MAYQLGQADRSVGSYESDTIEVTFHYRKPTHPALLDIKIMAASFTQKAAEYAESKGELFDEVRGYAEGDEDPYAIGLDPLLDRMDEEDRESWWKRYNKTEMSITSEDVEPVIKFVSDHIKTVEGVVGPDGEEPVDQWDDLAPRYQREILEAIPPNEVTEVFIDIKQSISLSPDKKNV